MKPAQEIRFETRQGELAGLRWGQPGATRVLALHGWLDNANSFLPLAQHLDDLDLVALDLAGHGHSHWRGAGLWYHYIDFILDGFAAAEALGWDRFHLLGHSLGASIAMAMAAAQPERVQSLILIESLGPMSGELEKIVPRLQKATRSLQRDTRFGLRRFSSPDQAATARQSNGRIEIDHHSAQVLVGRSLNKKDGGWFWRTDPRLLFDSPIRWTEAQVQALLQGVTAPTLLVQADSGIIEFVTPDHQARLAILGPAQHLRLPGHHHLHMVSPEPIATAIMNHLQQTVE